MKRNTIMAALLFLITIGIVLFSRTLRIDFLDRYFHTDFSKEHYRIVERKSDTAFTDASYSYVIEVKGEVQGNTLKLEYYTDGYTVESMELVRIGGGSIMEGASVKTRILENKGKLRHNTDRLVIVYCCETGLYTVYYIKI